MKTIPSIDFHIDGLQISSFVRLGDDFIVTGKGGAGGWYSGDELETIAEMTEFEATFGVFDTPGWADAAEKLLRRWQAEGTPLTTTSLPHANVLDDGVDKIIFPRTNR